MPTKDLFKEAEQEVKNITNQASGKPITNPAGLEPTDGFKDKFLDAFRRGYYYPKNGTRIIDDPTFLGFSLMFDYEGSKLFKGYSQVDYDGNVTGELPTTDCAFAYLQRLGEKTRMKYLKAFVEGLKYINQEKSYFWQTIEGLDTLWTDFNDFKKMPIASEWEVNIKTLESIDLKIFGLMELYRKAVFDYDYTREVIPSNLQRFNMTIYINEIRNFRPAEYKMGNKGINSDGNVYGKVDYEALLGLDDVYGEFNFENIMSKFKSKDEESSTSSNQSTTDLVNWLNKDESGIIIGYTGCKFHPSGGGELLQNISNNSVDQAVNNLKIKAKSASVASVLAWYNDKIDAKSENGSLSDKDMWEQIENRTKNLLKSAASDYFNKTKRTLKSRSSTVIKDNIPGGLLGSVQELKRGNLINALYQLAGSHGLGDIYEGDSYKPTDKIPNKIADVYDGDLAYTSDSTPNKIADVYINEGVTKTSRIPNKIADVYDSSDAAYVSDSTPNPIGEVYPDLENQMIQQRLEENNNESALSGLTVHPNLDTILSDRNDLDDTNVYPDLANELIESRLEESIKVI